MSVNRITLLGNLGADPEIKYMADGTAKATFTLATNEKYKNRSGEPVTETQWHRLVLWRKLGELAEKFLKKGDQVYIEGKLTYRSYDDNKGEKRYITEVVAKDMTLLPNRRGADDIGQQPSGVPLGGQEQPVVEQQTDGLPF